jgi:hypothetical protein
MLCELPLCDGADFASGVKQNRARAGGALIESENEFRHAAMIARRHCHVERNRTGCALSPSPGQEKP